MARGAEKMPRFFVGRGLVKQKSCDRINEKTIREQSHVSGDVYGRRSECSGRGHHLKARRRRI
jgi:hypothetical protein